MPARAAAPRCLILIAAVLTATLGVAPARVPSKEEPQRTVLFAFNKAEWRDVFRWLTDLTGKPVISVYRPPGTFSFRGPADKEYTIPEVVDIIKEALQNCDR